jgi:hypothetical protein
VSVFDLHARVLEDYCDIFGSFVNLAGTPWQREPNSPFFRLFFGTPEEPKATPELKALFPTPRRRIYPGAVPHRPPQGARGEYRIERLVLGAWDKLCV